MLALRGYRDSHGGYFLNNTILLDLDGTLTDPFLGISRCIAHALQKLELPVPDDLSLRHWIGPPLKQSFARYFQGLTVTRDPKLAVDYYRERFTHTGVFENAVYPGIPELLAELAEAGHSLLVATAKPTVYAARIVAHFELDQWLCAVHGSEFDGTRIDKVDLLQYTIDREGLDAKLCTMIGDREHDMLAGRYHGMSAIGVLWGYGTESELHEAGAQYLVETPGELLTIL